MPSFCHFRGVLQKGNLLFFINVFKYLKSKRTTITHLSPNMNLCGMQIDLCAKNKVNDVFLTEGQVTLKVNSRI